MAPCISGGAASMRHASTEMSCVAEQNATSSASAATVPRFPVGSMCAMLASPTAMPACAISIQLRRRPSSRPRIGSSSRSTTGAQKNFTE
jgi:hypothetical protein